jgi:rod shape-determining protein MreD
VINEITRNTVRFFILLFVQVLIIKNIDLGRFINPFLYVLFIISLPFETPRMLLLLLAFIMGLAIDLFYDTLGMHAAASVFMAFCRPAVFNFFAPREGYESGIQPGIRNMGLTWFISCSSVLILLHHFVLFYLEVFRFSEFFSTFFRVIMSSLFTLGLCVLSQYLLNRKRLKE